MHRLPLAAALLAVAGACIHRPPLHPARADQAVATDPHSAAAEVGGVRLTVHPDDWRGWPEDLDDDVTPVEIFVENGSDKEIVLKPALFSLALPNGFRYDALTPAEVRRFLGQRSYYAGAGGYYYYGAYGVYPWPGLYLPWPHYYPYYWWGDPWFGPPAPPPPPRPPPVATPSGRLAAGGKVSALVFFPVPASRLRQLTVEALVVGSDGATIGRVELPFERHESARPGRRQAAQPVGPPPSTPPPAPPPAQPMPPPAPQGGP